MDIKNVYKIAQRAMGAQLVRLNAILKQNILI